MRKTSNVTPRGQLNQLELTTPTNYVVVTPTSYVGSRLLVILDHAH